MDNRDIQVACSKVCHILGNLINPEQNGTERISASMAISMTALIGAASCLMDGFDPELGKVPEEDHILFAALLAWCSCHLETSGRLAITTSPELILETMDHYEKFTGEDARPLLNKAMMRVVDEATKVDRSSFGENSKFLPH